MAKISARGQQALARWEIERVPDNPGARYVVHYVWTAYNRDDVGRLLCRIGQSGYTIVRKAIKLDEATQLVETVRLRYSALS